jgi:hypothetical protein
VAVSYEHMIVGSMRGGEIFDYLSCINRLLERTLLDGLYIFIENTLKLFCDYIEVHETSDITALLSLTNALIHKQVRYQYDRNPDHVLVNTK